MAGTQNRCIILLIRKTDPFAFLNGLARDLNIMSDGVSIICTKE